MPQPFKNKLGSGSLGTNYFPESGLENRPTISAAIGRCIGAASLCELQLYRLYFSFLGSQAATAYATWESVGGRRNRISILRNVGNTVLLKNDDIDLFEASIKYCESIFSRRDKLAHGIWGYTNTLPNDALLIDPKGSLAVESFQLRQNNHNANDTPPDLADYIMVYSETDLNNLYTEIFNADVAIDQFRGYYHADESKKEGWLKLILSNPEIEDRKKKIKRQRDKS